MPVGLADELTRGELVDLVRFLSELGKVGPYAVSKARVARRVEVLANTPENVTLVGDGKSFDPAAVPDAGWTSVYSTVAGDVPVASIPVVESKAGPVRVVRAEAEVAIGGKVELVAAGPIEKVWIDGQPQAVSEKVTLELAQGVHTITLLVRDEPSGKLRLELADVPGSGAQLQFIGGK
jgi:hypothetical protein